MRTTTLTTTPTRLSGRWAHQAGCGLFLQYAHCQLVLGGGCYVRRVGCSTVCAKRCLVCVRSNSLTKTPTALPAAPQRACLHRLYEAGGRSESAQHDFMFLWDWHLQRK